MLCLRKRARNFYVIMPSSLVLTISKQNEFGLIKIKFIQNNFKIKLQFLQEIQTILGSSNFMLELIEKMSSVECIS